MSMTVREFSWGEWLAFQERHSDVTEGQLANYRRQNYGRDPKGWAGASTYYEGMHLARYGWPDGARRVREMSLPIVQRVAPEVVQAAHWGWDVTGAAYDVAEWLRGVPECWQSPTVSEQKPAVRILVDAFISAGIDARVYETRGAATVALALALQAAGYAVRVVWAAGFDSYVCPGTVSWTGVTLTDDNGGPLDTDRLLFALAHPASMRLFGITAGCVAIHETRGTAMSRLIESESLPSTRTPIPWDAEIVIPRLSLRDRRKEFESVEGAERWVRQQFDRITKGG